MSGRDLIRQVHEVKWAPAHAPTNYTAWMNSSEPYEITFRPEYEPYMMVPRDSVPLYDAMPLPHLCPSSATDRRAAVGMMSGSSATATTRWRRPRSSTSPATASSASPRSL
jgi:hypothetical protein